FISHCASRRTTVLAARRAGTPTALQRMVPALWLGDHLRSGSDAGSHAVEILRDFRGRAPYAIHAISSGDPFDPHSTIHRGGLAGRKPRARVHGFLAQSCLAIRSSRDWIVRSALSDHSGERPAAQPPHSVIG